MKTVKQKRGPASAKESAKELSAIASALSVLADHLEGLLARRQKLTERRERGLSALDWKAHECKVEAGQLLDKAVEVGGFRGHGSLRRLVGSRRFKLNPEFGHSSAFEYTCLKWIPKQPDGFDFLWKSKQIGEVGAYAMAMRYLAICIAEPRVDEAGQKAASSG
jgi:hypothetical protein